MFVQSYSLFWFIAGFIQPDVLFNKIQGGDPDGFLARMLLVTPQLCSFRYEDYQYNDTALTLEDILRRTRTNHIIPNLEYNFSDEALDIFKVQFNTLCKMMDNMDVFEETEQRSVVNKIKVRYFSQAAGA